MHRFSLRSLLVFGPAALLLLLAACGANASFDLGSGAEVAVVEAMATLAVEPPPPTEAIAGSRSLSYYLGDGTIAQNGSESYPTMPIPVMGAISVPEGAGPFPVAIVLHGRHPRCYSDQAQLDEVWPCPFGEEPRYDIGFFNLLDALAARGYVAVAPSVNGAYTNAFRDGGQPSLDELQPLVDDRMERILQLHLDKLAAANRGEPIFGDGLDLTGKLDLSTLLLAGHSTAGSSANAIARAGDLPVRALLLLAPATFANTGSTADIPTAVLLPGCDGDLAALPGQAYLETARLESAREQPVASVLLAGASHNNFNQELVREGIDDGYFARNPACEAMRLTAAEQQAFLASFAADFFDEARGLATALGAGDPEAPLPAERYGRAAPSNALFPTGRRLTLLAPPRDDGSVTWTAEGSLAVAPCLGGSVCDTAILLPGNPAAWKLSWQGEGAALRMSLPEVTSDASGYDAIRLRAVVNPAEPASVDGEPVSFSVALTDAAGQTTAVPLPAPLPFPLRSSYETDGYRFTPLYPVEYRLPLSGFEGVDLGNLDSVSLVFDGSSQGAIVVPEVELIKGE